MPERVSQPFPQTVGGWLASRTPPPPDPLRFRIMVALGDAADHAIADTERVCLDAAERVLSGLFVDDDGERHEAADLLAADALVTYALEFAAESPAVFTERATRALERLGQLHQAPRA